MQKCLAEIVRHVKDPRVKDAFLSITGVEVTPDLKYAKVFYSSLYGEEKEVAAGLKAATGYIRRELAGSMNLRITPELTFVRDRSLAYGAHISTLLNQITYASEDQEDSEGSAGSAGSEDGANGNSPDEETEE